MSPQPCWVGAASHWVWHRAVLQVSVPPAGVGPSVVVTPAHDPGDVMTPYPPSPLQQRPVSRHPGCLRNRLQTIPRPLLLHPRPCSWHRAAPHHVTTVRCCILQWTLADSSACKGTDHCSPSQVSQPRLGLQHTWQCFLGCCLWCGPVHAVSCLSYRHQLRVCLYAEILPISSAQLAAHAATCSRLAVTNWLQVLSTPRPRPVRRQLPLLAVDMGS